MAAEEVEVFIYTEGAVVPEDVVHVRVHPSVTVIPRLKFYERSCLVEVELNEGLVEIGKQAFSNCSLLRHINIPTTVEHISEYAFTYTKLSAISIPDNIRYIGERALCRCMWINFRLPLAVISHRVLSGCGSMFSLELPESTRIESEAFNCCYSLRNISIPEDAEIGSDVFRECQDLIQIFDTREGIINALKHRFDNLSIHKMIYYHSYNNVTADQLNNATNMRRSQRRSLRSKLDPSGKQQDCLGMTPLHILACSTVQNIELYKVLITKYPETLTTKDRWGAVPLLYAVWGGASDEIILHLIESHKSLHPNYELNWTYMMNALFLSHRNNAKCCPSIISPLGNIQRLLDLQQMHFPQQDICWEAIIENKVNSIVSSTPASIQLLRSLAKLSISNRVNGIGLESFRENITKTIMEGEMPAVDREREIDGKAWISDVVNSKLRQFETEYSRFKEATTIIELVLWKHKINDYNNCNGSEHIKKKLRMDRGQCRINCGANIVIEHVLPYLVSPLCCESCELN